MQLRIEFWLRDNVYGVDLLYNGIRATVTRSTNPVLYEQLETMFIDTPSTMEYPQDDCGIEVHKFVLA